MRIFVDTEFVEAGKSLELVSLGAISERGDDFYAISRDFNPLRANDWVRQNVLAKLEPPSKIDRVSERVIAERFRDWVNGICGIQSPEIMESPPEFWGYFCDYDYVILSRMFGGMMKWPEGWPQYFNDIRQWMTQLGVSRQQLPADPPNQHNALADAIWIRAAYDILVGMEQAWFSLMANMRAQQAQAGHVEVASTEESLLTGGGSGNAD